jgi:hypothetical protein
MNAVCVNHVRPLSMPGATAVMAVALFGPAVYDSADTYSAPKLLGGIVSGCAWANFTCTRGCPRSSASVLVSLPIAHREKGLLIHSGRLSQWLASWCAVVIVQFAVRTDRVVDTQDTLRTVVVNTSMHGVVVVLVESLS